MFTAEIAEYVEEFRQKTSDPRVVTKNRQAIQSRALLHLQDSLCGVGVLGGGYC